MPLYSLSRRQPDNGPLSAGHNRGSRMQISDAVSRALRSPAFKLALISTLILLLLIPLALVFALIGERQGRAREVAQDIGRSWGPEQRMLGPLLVVPYVVRIERREGDNIVEQLVERRAMLTPETLDVAGRLESKSLHRSIFEVPVYLARLRWSGRFAAPRLSEIASDIASIRWQDSVFVMGLSGVAGLKDAAELRISGRAPVSFAPSIGLPQTTLAGIHAKPWADGAPGGEGAVPAFDFAFDLTLSGSQQWEAAPVARQTRIAIESDWPHPSFLGAFLPDSRSISERGFVATWRVPHLARSVPSAWTLGEGGPDRLAPFAFGVRLAWPVDFHTLVTRAAKYGILFLGLTFMAVFCLELLSARPVHAVQYLFTGLALVFFYVLLLSLAEHIGFAGAYLAASLATGLMLAAYLGAALRSIPQGLMMLGVLSAAFGLLYLTLQMEDYALLAGALLGFTALTAVMFATLRVDWSGGRGTGRGAGMD